MVPARYQFVDYDARRDPKTDRWCCKCQKDLMPGQPHRHVYLAAEMCAVHPEDIAERGPQPDDYGWHLLGMDCAKKLGLEWSTDIEPKA